MSRLGGCLGVLFVLLLPGTAVAAPPANDAFASAAPLTLGPDATLGTLIDATREPAENAPIADRCPTLDTAPSCARTAWYSVTPTTTADITVDTCDLGTEVDTVIAVFTGATIGGLTSVGSNDDACGGGPGGRASRLTFTPVANTTYRIQVAGFGADEGQFYLRAGTTSTPANAPVDTIIERGQSWALARLVPSPPDDVYDTRSGPRHTASFSFSGIKNGAAVADETFECALDGAAFSACTSPIAYDDVVSGTHEFRVRSTITGTADPTPAIQRFRLGAPAPDTTLVDGPIGDTANNPDYRFGSDSTDSFGAATCTYDGGAPAPCVLYTASSRPGACLGAHTVTAVTFDRAGTLDPTPFVAATNRTSALPCAAPTLTNPVASAGETGGGVSVQYDSHGLGGTLTMDLGLTTAYGIRVQKPIANGAGSASISAFFLTPSTQYHYKLTYKTPLGEVSLPDGTFTTIAPTTVPKVTIGDATLIGRSALRVPITVDPNGAGNVGFGVLVDDVTPEYGSPKIYSPESSSATGTFVVEIVDLDPATTYHLRGFVEGSASNAVSTAEKLVTTPAAPAVTPTPTATAGASATPTATPTASPTATPAPPFKLSRANVKVGKIRRRSKSIKVTLTGLPAGTAVNVSAKGKKRLGARSGVAQGTLTLKVKLSKKARKALRKKRPKAVTITVTATPPGAAPSQITLKVKKTK